MLFRNRRLVRVIACYLLLQIISSLAFPTVSLAMMGPSQPEFTSYEAPGATDLVNLVTGDFTYSLPVLDIPGPERSFSLPLTYKAGIQLEQEASWVGLGWTLNAGAIARSVNGYADDANNDPVQLTFNKQVDRGWNSSVLGIVNLGWNSVTGHNGSVDLLNLASIGWNEDGINRGDLIGIGYTAGQGVSVDPIRLVMAIGTIATMGGGSVLSVASNVGIQAGKQAVVGVAMSAVGLGHMSGAVSYNGNPTRDVQTHVWGDEYWNFYANNNTENSYGSLYFGKMSQNTVSVQTVPVPYQPVPTIQYGAQVASASSAQLFNYVHNVGSNGNTLVETASDIYQDGTVKDTYVPEVNGPGQSESGTIDYFNNLKSSVRPISVAHDYFSVMGESASGTIRPYRLDVGSIAFPKPELNVREHQYNGQKIYEIIHYKHMAIPFLDNKVGFRYENSLSNGYNHHQYTAAGTDEPTGFTLSADKSKLVVTDPHLLTARTGAARKGLYEASNGGNPHLVTGKHVIWYSNAEISAMYNSSTNGSGNGFLEFEHPQAVNVLGSVSNNFFRSQLPPSGIGAFAVTVEDGTTYHYSLPVYQYKTYTESNEVVTAVGSLGKMTKSTGIRTPSNLTGGQATTWLLTAITSADYLDRNNSGTVDNADWGGWVRFEYGKFSSQYKWRQPYIGTSYTDDTPTITSRSFTEGYKETYYLNAIATRSHTALFLKSVREDGRGHFQAGVTDNLSNLGIDEQKPASSLRLDEIVLLDNATLARLCTTGGVAATVPALTNALGSSLGPYADDPFVMAGDYMENVLDVHDVEADSRIRQFINANAIKRVHFNYDYDLCRSMPNSFKCLNGQLPSPSAMSETGMYTGRGGKLTLKSVSFYGPSVNNAPTKIIPDFTFSYEADGYNVTETNPAYAKERWDAFGMYQATGQATVDSHRPPAAYGYQAPWSLSKITSPLGGVTEIKYERDQYAHVSEHGTVKLHLSNSNSLATFNVSFPNGSLSPPLTSVLKPNQQVYLTGVARFSDCIKTADGYQGELKSSSDHYYYNGLFTVASVNSSNQVTFTAAPTATKRGWFTCNGTPVTGQGAEFDMVVSANVTGGDVRVAAITTREGANSYQVRYRYTLPGTGPGIGDSQHYNSTGVISKEPPFLNGFNHPVDGAYDYPATPVLYSQVTVLRGLFRSGDDNDFETREVYSFHTPASSMLTESLTDWKTINPDQGASYPVAFTSMSASNNTVVDVGLIGQPRKVEVYNRRGEQELSTDFTYASTISNADGLTGQGHYTEGVLNTESVGTYRVSRSTKEYVPAVLVGSRSTRNNLTITNSNVLYDFLTGQVLETALTNSQGKVTHSRVMPAYTLPGNEEMGAKGDNRANRHMLAQSGASYVYQEIPGSPAYNPLLPFQNTRMLSAGVQTWQKTWSNYREADANGAYQNVTGQSPIWRQAAYYTWQTPQLEADGTYKNFVDFSWTGQPDSRWLKAGEAVRYDYYSHLLESRDLNGSYSAQKTGYGQTQVIAKGVNARYTELGYSGAEDAFAVAGSTHFGGEVIGGISGMLDNQLAHTGFYSYQAAAGQKGLYYRAQIGSDVDAGKQYRLHVWAHSNATQGKLYASINGARIAESSRGSATTRKAGSWYLLTLLVTVPMGMNGQVIEFGCVNDNGQAPANFDDFRVAPLTATVTSHVYDPQANYLLYSLDNDNLFTRQEYTPTGRLKRVYKETFDGTGTALTAQKLVKEYDYNYARLNAPTWISQNYRCLFGADGNYIGVEREVVDVNPLNSPPAQSHWEPVGASIECTPPVCPEGSGSTPPSRLINNQCQTAVQNGSSECVPCQNGGVMKIYHWKYVNPNAPAPDTFTPCASNFGNCNPQIESRKLGGKKALILKKH